MDRQAIYKAIQEAEEILYNLPVYELERIAYWEEYLDSLYDTLEAMDQDNEFNEQL